MQNARDAGRPAAAAPSGWLGWLCAAALFAGTCDIVYAIAFSYLRSGIAPSRILQSVAFGALGPAAFKGGAATAAAGLGFHYLNALIITAIFFGAAALLPALIRRPLITGVLYGIVVWVVMNNVVIPMSRIGTRRSPPAIVVVTEVPLHMFLIGVPIALAARKALSRAASR